MTLLIRKMTEDDLDSVLAIEQACFVRSWTRNNFIDEITSVFCLPVVSEQNGVVTGYLCLAVVLDEAEILNIAVNPDLHSCGIGSMLMQWACSESVKRGATVLRLEVRANSIPAIALYEKFGFVRTGVRKGYYEFGTDAILMDKKLIQEGTDAV